MGELPLDPRSVANYILLIRRHFGYETTQLELQKILYFCYGTFLTKFGTKLCDGYFEAWEHGPVHPLIYREFSDFRASPITRTAQSTDLISGDTKTVPIPKDREVRSSITEVVLQLRGLTASQLREKSHAPGAPWHSVVESAKKNLASRVRIPDSVIKGGFSRHILPLREESEVADDFEDYPPEPDRRSKY